MDMPSGTPRGWGVFAHGFALSKDSPAAARICKQLGAEGIGMLRFDNLGLGQSSGNWGVGSFTVMVAAPGQGGVVLARPWPCGGHAGRALVRWGGCHRCRSSDSNRE